MSKARVGAPPVRALEAGADVRPDDGRGGAAADVAADVGDDPAAPLIVRSGLSPLAPRAGAR